MPSFRTLNLAVAVFLVTGLPALAQDYRTGPNPNLGHFFMGRREIQILDDNAQVNDYRTNPAAAGGTAGVPNIGRNAPLPRAGWQQYSTSIPSVNRANLPTVNNGVPRQLPPQPGNVAAKSAKAGAYKAQKAAAQAPTRPKETTAKTYAPYKGYGPSVGEVSRVTAGGGADAATKVQGSLLNRGGNMVRWNRTRSNY